MGLDPVLAHIDVGGDVAVVGGASQQEDDGQEVESTGDAAETEQGEDSPLERAPGPQERHQILIAVHFTQLYFYSSSLKGAPTETQALLSGAIWMITNL